MEQNTTPPDPKTDKFKPEALLPIGKEQLRKFTQILQKYKAGRSNTEGRIIAAENWWKLRNTTEEKKETAIGGDGGFVSVSGWLHNVIVSKHADAMEAYPEPNILPREEGDRAEAEKLSSIIPCVLEQNRFEETYDDAMWQKMKTGTAAYKIIWDRHKLNGLGDIGIECVSLLNLYWEPGISNIQKSRYFFHTELCDKDLLLERYPDKLADGLKTSTFVSAKFLYDDAVDTSDKATVIEVYYHKYVNGKNTLQYCKYVDDVVLYASENDVEPLKDRQTGQIIRSPMAMTGFYDHGKYPYVFDQLFPIEGSPLGYGYVDICRNPQTEIDLIKTSFVKSAMVGATPRYFSRGDGINEEEFLDLSKPIVHVPGGQVSDDAIRRIEHTPLDGNYINLLDRTIQELRETSGNTETSTGNISSGVTAASAIAALQEASGKGSRDSTQSAYRAYSEIVDFCIELIRQFYDLPRQFRIIGQYGAQRFISYSNSGIKEKHQGFDFGGDMGYRMPVFDIKVTAQKQSVYTKVTQNELALQFFQMGFFNPEMTDQTLMCLDMMDFDGKDGIMQKVAEMGTMHDKLVRYMQLALTYAKAADPMMAESIAKDIVLTMGGDSSFSQGFGTNMIESDHIAGIGKKEPAVVAGARGRAAASTQPSGGNVLKGGRAK